ncbi:MAG: zinc-ribbon domain-containing protein [Rhodothermales bacterium]
MSTTTVCTECGARLPVGSTQCDLCGTTVTADTPATPPPAEAQGDGAFCNACGWKNPLGARFCSQCGQPLQTLGEAPIPPTTPAPSLPPPADAEDIVEDTPGDLGRQIVLIVGAGILLVVMLYVITIVSGNGSFNPTVTGSNSGGGVVGTAPPTAATTPTDAPSPFGEITPALAEQVTALEDQIDATSGAEQTQLKRELVNLLIGSGRPDLAANVQEEVAQATNAPVDWERAGMLLFEWMDALPNSAIKTAVAQRTITAIERVLQERPNDLDLRATLGWAALYDPSNPMRAITETNAVLEQDPNHVQANFNRGQMLLQIGRVDEALAQFEKLLTIVEPTSATHQQVSALITQLQNADSGS